MDEEKLKRAAELEEEARRLRESAFAERPMPDFWRVGQKVRFLESQEFAWTKGAVWKIVQLRDEAGTIPAKEYQVFYTSPPGGYGIFWTTPDDVELVEDCPMQHKAAHGGPVPRKGPREKSKKRRVAK